MRRLRGIGCAGAAIVALLLGAAPASARDAVVTSFDGTPIATSFFPAQGLQPGQRAPTILLGHGWGGSRDTDPNSSSDDTTGGLGVGPLRRAGYNVLTWDARGWGESGGTIEVDSRDFEGRDVQALISFVAQQPEALLDGANDPRVGMSGVSYAGGIQFVTAGLDSRVDVIAPTIAWNSLVTSLDKDGSAKGGWGSVLYASAQGHKYDSHIDTAFSQATTTGGVSDDIRDWFASRGAGPDLLNNIRVPTFLIQGTADTLFTLPEAIANYGIFRHNGVPVKMLWFCGGHGACLSAHDPPGLIEREEIAWYDRYLKRDTAIDTGPRFEWVADDGVLRAGDDYPLRHRAPLVGTGSGTLPLTTDSASSGTPIAATPAANAVNVNISPPSGPAEVVGEPKLTLTYSGTAVPAGTFVYAQIVDGNSNRVLGNLATPIPLTLDGASRTIVRSLEGVAAHGTPDSIYRLQLIPASNLYGPQRSAGSVTFSSIRVELPVITGSAVTVLAPLGARSACAGFRGSRPQRSRARPLALRLRKPGGTARRLRRARRLGVSTCAPARLRSVVLTLRDRHGRLVGRSRATTVTGRRRVSLGLRRRVARGRYTLVATGRNPDGRRGRLSYGVRFR